MTGARAARIANSHVGRTFTLARDAVRVVDSAVDGAGVTLAAATALPRASSRRRRRFASGRRERGVRAERRWGGIDAV